jgi:hypothetical protein
VNVLICKVRFQLYKNTFNKNFKYEVTKVTDKYVTVEGDYGIPIEMVRKNFIYSYCRTAHSLQGKSIDKPITIFDYKFHRVTNEWLYVAISRCTDLNNVTFYDYDEAEERNLELENYFKQKVENHKKQDKAAKRKISKDNYINVKWFLDNLGKHCIYCNEVLEYEIEDNRITCQSDSQS